MECLQVDVGVLEVLSIKYLYYFQLYLAYMQVGGP